MKPRIASQFPVRNFTKTNHYQVLIICCVEHRDRGSPFFLFAHKQAYTFQFSSHGNNCSVKLGFCCFVYSVTWNLLEKIQALNFPEWKSKILIVFGVFLTSNSWLYRSVMTWEPLVFGQSSHHLEAIEPEPWSSSSLWLSVEPNNLWSQRKS